MSGIDILKTRRIDLDLLFGKVSARRPDLHPLSTMPNTTPGSVLFDFRVLFENAYDAVLVTDDNGRVLASNRRAHTFFRDAADRLTGLSLVELIPGVTPELINSIAATATNRRFTVLQAWCQRSDNTLFPAEVVITGSSQNGKCDLFVQIRDATVRRASEERLLSITLALNTAAVGIGTADLAGCVTYANPCLAQKLQPDQAAPLIGLPLSKLLGGASVCDEMLEAVRNNRIWSDEFSLVVKGQVCWFQADVVPHQDSEGVLTGMVFCLRDIGDRKRAEAAEYQISRSRLMMESMSTACHLLGQPATVMLSCLELVRARKTPDPAADSLLYEMVHEAAEEMRAILQKMHVQSMTAAGEETTPDQHAACDQADRAPAP